MNVMTLKACPQKVTTTARLVRDSTVNTHARRKRSLLQHRHQARFQRRRQHHRRGTAADPAQPPDEQWIGRQRLRPIDQGVERLVVPGGRELEAIADGRLLGAGDAPPLPLEGEHRPIARIDAPGILDGGDVLCVA